MRKPIGFTLAIIGAVLLAAALILKVWVAPQAVKIPDDTKVTTVATGTGSGINLANGQPFIDTPITATRNLSTGKADDDTVIWTMKVKLSDAAGNAVTSYTDRVAVDRDSMKAKSGHGEKVIDDKYGERAVKHEGLTYHFPFHTEKKSYDFFDVNTGKAYPAKYTGTGELDDLDVYTFEQTVPATKIREAQVPGQLLGVAAPQVTLDVFYTNKRKLWVEPTTGWILKAQEAATTTLRMPGTNQDVATVLSTDLTFTDETVDDLADRAEDDKGKIDLVEKTLPLTALIVGGVLLVVGLVLVLTGRRAAPAAGVAAGGPAAATATASPSEVEPAEQTAEEVVQEQAPATEPSADDKPADGKKD